MNAKELRIGNLVRHAVRLDAEIILPEWNSFVRGIAPGGLDFSDHRAELVVPIQHCTGIKLTERVLHKMGFSNEFVKPGYIAYGGPFNLFILRKPTEEDPDYLWEYSEGGQECVTYLYSVHEVQNLYFTLFKKELEFELFQEHDL